MCRTLTLWDTKLRFCEGKVFRQSITKSKKWKCVDNLTPNNIGYIRIGLTNKEGKRKMFQLHRIVYKAYHPSWDIMDSSMNNCIDHIDGNKQNNNIENLRVVTNQENQFNTKAKGYYFNKRRNKWMAYIMVDGKLINLGYYDTEAEARQAYLTAKAKLHIIKDRTNCISLNISSASTQKQLL